MKACKSQIRDSVTKHFPTSSVGKMGCASATMWPFLFEAIVITCNPSEWRLFIGSSSRSLKAVLLHNENNYPSLLMAHSVHLKEDYTSVKMLVSALKYDDYGWEVIGDLKMSWKCHSWWTLKAVSQKFPCFLCLWDSCDTTAHYHRKDWPQRTESSVGKSNVKWEPLIEP